MGVAVSASAAAPAHACVVPHGGEEILVDERGHGGRGQGGRVLDLVIVVLPVLARPPGGHARVLAVVVVGLAPEKALVKLHKRAESRNLRRVSLS